MDSNTAGDVVAGSGRFRLWVMVSSGGVRALVLALGARGGIVVEVGLCCSTETDCGTEPVDDTGVWLKDGRAWLGLSGPGGRGDTSVCRFNTPVPGISDSSLRGPSVRLLGFMIRLGAPPDPITSGYKISM